MDFEIKITKLGLTFLLVGFFNACITETISDAQINQITSGEHGFLVFTFPVVGTYSWFCEVDVDEKKYSSSIFLEGETYKVPVPVGQRRIKYKFFARAGKTRYHSGEDSGLLLATNIPVGNYSGLEVEVKKNQIISINIQVAGPDKPSFLNSILQQESRRVEAKIEIEKDIATEKKIPKPIIIGKIFSVNGEKIEIMRGQSELKPGNMFYIFNKNKMVGKLVVTQVLHTKASGKIITSQGEIQKDMEYGRMN